MVSQLNLRGKTAKGLSFGIQQVRRLDSATEVRLLVLLSSKLSTQSAGI